MTFSTKIPTLFRQIASRYRMSPQALKAQTAALGWKFSMIQDNDPIEVDFAKRMIEGIAEKYVWRNRRQSGQSLATAETCQ